MNLKKKCTTSQNLLTTKTCTIIGRTDSYGKPNFSVLWLNCKCCGSTFVLTSKNKKVG